MEPTWVFVPAPTTMDVGELLGRTTGGGVVGAGRDAVGDGTVGDSRGTGLVDAATSVVGLATLDGMTVELVGGAATATVVPLFAVVVATRLVNVGATDVAAPPRAEFFVRGSADSLPDPLQAEAMTMKRPSVKPTRRFIVLPTR